MRSERQIEAWLKRHKWYESFRRQRELDQLRDRRTGDALQPLLGRHTILGAFDWTRSDEGLEFWAIKNKEFMIWYEKPANKTK